MSLSSLNCAVQITTSRKTAKLISADKNYFCTLRNKCFACKGLRRSRKLLFQTQNRSMHNSCSASNSDCSQSSKTYHTLRNFQIISLYLREFCSIPCLEQFKSGAIDMVLISKPVIPLAVISRQLEKSVSLCHNFSSTSSDTFTV